MTATITEQQHTVTTTKDDRGRWLSTCTCGGQRARWSNTEPVNVQCPRIEAGASL